MPTTPTKGGRSRAKTSRKTTLARKSRPAGKKSASRSRASSALARGGRSSGRGPSAVNRSKPRSQVRAESERSRSKSSKSAGRGGAAARSRSAARGAKTTVDHDEIRHWVEARGGFPATVAGTERKSEGAGLLRIDFPGYSGKDSLERIEWDEFFEKFDEAKLAFLCDNKKNSRFSKFVARRGKRG